MVELFNGLRNRLSETFQSRIWKLPKVSFTSRLPRSVWIFPFALLLAVWANQGSREEGRIDWLRTNPPGTDVWRVLLERKGFGAIEDPSWREKAYAEMPEARKGHDSAFLSEDRTTFAIRTDGDWLFYGLGRRGAGGQTVKRSLWEPLGIGWDAVARFSTSEIPQFLDPHKKEDKNTAGNDPRRLDY